MASSVFFVWLFNVFWDSFSHIAFKKAAANEHRVAGKPYWLGLFHQPYLWLGIFATAFEAVAWLWFLSLVPLSIGVMMASFNIVGVMVLGRIFLGEKLNRIRVAGVCLITFGVILVGWGHV